jgi:glycogen debranching enzyme
VTRRQTVTAFSGYTVLCTAPDGTADGPRHGLLHRDARVLSRHRLSVEVEAGAERPALISSANPENDRWEAILHVPRSGGHADGPLLPQDAVEIVVRRRVGPGMVESIEITNRSAVPWQATLGIELDADFADAAELGRARRQSGEVRRTVDRDERTLTFDYAVAANGRRSVRGLRVEVAAATSGGDLSEGGLAFPIRLAGGAAWEASIRYAVLDGGWRAPADGNDDPRAAQRRAWRRRRPSIETGKPLDEAVARAADDLFDLRNWELETQLQGYAHGDRWVINAGMPAFTGLFGRDVLTCGWQSALLGTRAIRGALAAVAATQAEDDDPWRDAEPGKLIHEMRSGPLAELRLTPRDAYYGSQTTAAMFLLALSELWHWTGDDDVLRRHVGTALLAMDWARRYGDRDADGFLEYERRSPEGLRNQGWKDSDEAIRWPDGSAVEGPVATVEEQAFHVLALERMAEILVALGDDRAADGYLQRAADLRDRWDRAFWMPGERYYALALDGKKRPVPTIASNPGHALGAGIVPRDRARMVADRLLGPDLFNGWGVRSLSADHPSFNPLAYHLGCVWPVEQATFALGFKRYGLDEHLDRLASAMLDAAILERGRIPEAWTGHDRAAFLSPIPYPKAALPQAWSASALIQIVQILLGLYPFAPLRVLAVVRPRLPRSLPTLTLRRLQVGRASVDLRFDRREDGSAAWRVIGQRGALAVVGAGPPNDVGSGSLVEALEAGVLLRAPGRLARTARIGLGLGLD